MRAPVPRRLEGNAVIEPHATATAVKQRPGRRRIQPRTLLLLLPAALLLAVTAAIAAGLFTGRDSGETMIEQGGVSWKSVTVTEGAGGDGATIRAAVSDERLDGKGATEESAYVLWMLGSDGTYDDRPHVDSRAAERALEMSHDDQVQIQPRGLGERSTGLIDSGQYSPSVDGTIEYRDIPPGRYQLRALVLEPGGVWDGSLAARTIEVE